MLRSDEGVHVGRKRVARPMRQAGLGQRQPAQGVPDHGAGPECASSARSGRAALHRPTKPWVADITYFPPLVGFPFLAVVMRVYSRRIVGWAMANPLKTALVLDALNMAL